MCPLCYLLSYFLILHGHFKISLNIATSISPNTCRKTLIGMNINLNFPTFIRHDRRKYYFLITHFIRITQKIRNIRISVEYHSCIICWQKNNEQILVSKHGVYGSVKLTLGIISACFRQYCLTNWTDWKISLFEVFFCQMRTTLQQNLPT